MGNTMGRPILYIMRNKDNEITKYYVLTFEEEATKPILS